jgi:hypothetical protein
LALPSSARPWIFAVACYIVVTLVFVRPFVDYGRLGSASYEGDSRLLIWTLAWDSHAILSGAPLFDANIYYPLPHALARAEHHIGIGLFALPVYAATGNPVLTYWFLWLLAFPLNALAMHALARRVTRDDLASLVAGTVYAFCFFRMHHAHGHIQLLWTWPLPLIPLAIERWANRPTWMRAAVVTVLVVVQALSSWYLAVFAAVVAITCGLALLPGRVASRAHMSQGTTALLAGTLIVAWFAIPYFGLAAGPATEAAANAADIAGYLVPPENTWLGQQLLDRTTITPRWIWGEQTTYAGLVTVVLALAGLWKARRHAADPVLAAVVVAGLFALALSFGPSPTGWAPFDLLAHLPGMELLRAPARFALVVMMAAALLAALGLSGIRRPAVRRAAVASAVAAILAEAYVVEFPGGKPRPLPTPAIYEAVPAGSGDALLSLPTYRGTPEAFRETDYLLFSTARWRPIVNGFGRQEPPGHDERMARLATFPAPAALALLRRDRVRYVVLHTRRDSRLTAHAEEARRSGQLRLVAEADGDYLFALR